MCALKRALPLVQTTITETIPQADVPDARIVTDLKREYVSGGAAWWFGKEARSLPWAIDDVTLAFSDDLYERMMTEAVVAASANIFKAGIQAKGFSITSAVADKDKEGYQQAADLVDWCERMLDDMETDLDASLWNLLDALVYGNKVAELVYEPDSSYTGKEQVALRGIHVKPRRALSFVVDPYKTLLGVLALFPGENVWPLTGVMIRDLKDMANFVPAEKLCVLTSRMVDNDPRGTSVLRAAYDPWWRKEQTKGEHQKYLARFATASLAGFTGKSAQPVVRRDAAGNVLTDSNGNPLLDYPTDVMRDALLAFQNGTVVVFPDGSPEGSRLQVIPAQGTGEPFLQAYMAHDREIIKAILTATLGVSEGEHSTRAQASVHQDSQQTIIGQSKRGVCTALRRQVLRRLIGYNYGAAAKRLTPHVSLGGTETEDIAKVWTALGQLYSSGYLDPSQLPKIDVQVNLPERDVVSASEDAASGDAEDVASQDTPPAPSAPVQPPTPGQPTNPTPVPAPAPQPARKEAA